MPQSGSSINLLLLLQQGQVERNSSGIGTVKGSQCHKWLDVGWRSRGLFQHLSVSRSGGNHRQQFRRRRSCLLTIRDHVELREGHQKIDILRSGAPVVTTSDSRSLGHDREQPRCEPRAPDLGGRLPSWRETAAVDDHHEKSLFLVRAL